MNKKQLVESAILAREKAYAPYSNFLVGAALLTKDGKVYTGCNIENASYPATNCAERTAVFKAVSEGNDQFEAIAIVGGKRGSKDLDYCSPCGICRQVLSEFCDDDFEIILARSEDDYKVLTLKELLPYSFNSDSL